MEARDRVEFIAMVAALVVRGKTSREERSFIALCANKSSAERHSLCLMNARLWSDTSTQSYIFAIHITRLPKSKYTTGFDSEAFHQQRLIGGIPPAPSALLRNAQRLVERSKEDVRWAEERELLTDEQVIASMLPLDELLELDELDIDAVADILMG